MFPFRAYLPSRATAVLEFIVSHSLTLLAGAIAALVWANIDAAGYHEATRDLAILINDVGMVFFFALMAKEVYDAMLPGGPLASVRQAAVPICAAIGGMAVPALVYVVLNAAIGRPELTRGWAIPCATDIAFAYLAVRLVFRADHPAIPFLLLLAIVDDAIGLVLLAVCYPAGPVSPSLLVIGIAAAVGFAWTLRRTGVKSFWWYLLGPGALAWYALFAGGLHPALAMVPIVPFMPHGPVTSHPRTHDATLRQFEHWWRMPVQVILLLFGLVNAGVAMTSVGLASGFVLAGLVIGKPIGIVLTVFGAERAGFRRPEGLDMRSVLVLGAAAGIGFTVALFFATAAFPAGETLNQAKMGALFSFVAFPIAVALGRLLLSSSAIPHNPTNPRT